MATIDPNDIRLSDQQRRLIAQVAEKTGRSPSQVLDEAVSSIPVQDDESGKRLRRILDALAAKAQQVPQEEFDNLMTEAADHARHGKS